MLVLADSLAAWFYQWRDGGHRLTIVFWLEATVRTNNVLLFFNYMVYLVDGRRTNNCFFTPQNYSKVLQKEGTFVEL